MNTTAVQMKTLILHAKTTVFDVKQKSHMLINRLSVEMDGDCGAGGGGAGFAQESLEDHKGENAGVLKKIVKLKRNDKIADR